MSGRCTLGKLASLAKRSHDQEVARLLTIIMVATSPYQCLTLSLLIIPPLLLGTYLLAAFPLPPASVYVHPSLASLPPTSKSWTIYPEDFYSGGSYATFPNGKVSLISLNTRSILDMFFFFKDSILAFGTREG